MSVFKSSADPKDHAVAPGTGKHTQRGEEPAVLAACVALLQHLLDSLLGILTLADLLERLARDDTLETLELESVAGGHQVVVVDDLDERLHLGALLLAGLAHAAGDSAGVALDACYEGVAIGVCLAAGIDGLDDDDLEGGDMLASAVRLVLPTWNPAGKKSSRPPNPFGPCPRDDCSSTQLPIVPEIPTQSWERKVFGRRTFLPA